MSLEDKPNMSLEEQQLNMSLEDKPNMVQVQDKENTL